MSPGSRCFLVMLASLLSSTVGAQETEYELGGHLKGRLLGQAFPDNSAFRQVAGETAGDLEGNLRLNFSAGKGAWSFDAAYQAFAGYGDRIADAGLLPVGAGLPDDDRRLFDLSKSIDDDGKFVALHRLDRLAVGYTSSTTVVRFGRQALSWGNGLIYSPMDLVNPFDPAAVDTEYKAGDDMLYAQFLRDNGDDLQFAYVLRRAVPSGDVEFDQSTVAIKYHGIAGSGEFDLLLASNYGDATLAFGGNLGIGGAIWRGDIVYVDSDAGGRFQLVTSFSYSWVWGGKNVSGLVEFFFDEFGADDDGYDTASLTQNQELLSRLVRGQSFTIGRQYVGAALTIEMNPLWLLTPTLFANTDDGSTLIQLVSRNNLADNMEFIGALNVPIGPDGSEYGGIELAMSGVFLSTDASVFAQLAWYF
ncbi:MAG: hypothetical protein R3192_15670 [Woeseiaceae bacterium]|nr:hypothetical protein [Woeseiaceae bacterium]